jgi:uncharacterized membrane protein YhaH (DUF805 family)
MSKAPVAQHYYDPDMFSYTGRIGRCRYLGYFAGMFLILLLVAITIGAVARGNNPFFQPIVWMIPMALIMLATAVRRLNDMHRSGWWALLCLIPVVNLFACAWLALAPGDPADNAYGPPLAPNTWLVIAGACLAPLLMAAMFSSLAMMASSAYRKYAKAADRQHEQAPEPRERGLPMAAPR